ncbi:I78 family peptidase inhibitor [Qipengyuania gaetbuli]|uniref:I78 family peptidase inhibitor n=1 Tax=Qipengyuania gaetbuli TaxID=266952 RepID=UPI001CD70CDD|nr:I78 family peptidase inhibitor [Qipengyuania gaetbuli]MCA0909677.1 hypothetical protein [Qipengyuania gaetbuli]
MRAMLAVLTALPLAACATTTVADGDLPPARAEGTCNAAAAQGHIGHTASQAMGAAILKDSGAQSLRWGPPESAWTMDYRPDRVNVRYDRDMKITEVTCG